jgi:hypothetical protein
LPSGSITGDLIVKIFSYRGVLSIYPINSGDPILFLVVNGHDSRLSPIVVDYITNEES